MSHQLYLKLALFLRPCQTSHLLQRTHCQMYLKTLLTLACFAIQRMYFEVTVHNILMTQALICQLHYPLYLNSCQ